MLSPRIFSPGDSSPLACPALQPRGTGSDCPTSLPAEMNATKQRRQYIARLDPAFSLAERDLFFLFHSVWQVGYSE